MTNPTKVLAGVWIVINCLVLAIFVLFAISVGWVVGVVLALILLMLSLYVLLRRPPDFRSACLGGAIGQILGWILGAFWCLHHPVRGHWDPSLFVFPPLAGLLGFFFGALVGSGRAARRRLKQSRDSQEEGNS